MILDSMFNEVDHQDYHGLSFHKISSKEFYGNLLAFDDQQDLYAINTNYLR